jgi:small subunit ribosomal protein S16
MATKIRLQRGGHKGYAYYRIVIADSKSPRDGKFIERIGTYNPNLNPAEVNVDFDRALYWVENGAQPTDTVRSLLKSQGVYLMKHLRGGVKKGAFDEASLQSKFDSWKENKEKAFEAIRQGDEKQKSEAARKEIENEKKVNETIAKKVADKKAEVAKAAAEAAKAEADAAAEAEAPAEEKPADSAATEPSAEGNAEQPAQA